MRFIYLLPFLLAANIAKADLPAVISDFRGADVIILGEIHDNPQHHETQAEIAAEIQPSALVFEMFNTPQAETINAKRWEGGGIKSLAEVFNWNQSGWPKFAYYADIIQASPDSVVFGAATPIDDVRDAMFEGAATIFGEGAEIYGLDQQLPTPLQTAREANQREAHCNALPEDQLAGMVEAQRLRDAILADTIFLALDEIGGPVIVITGNGHARQDWGLPAILRLAAPDMVVMTLGQFEAEPEGMQPFTHIIISDPIDREDPCLDLRG